MRRLALPTLLIGAPAWAADFDGDGHDDGADVCPATSDPGQADTDGDGWGDACAHPTATVDSRAVLGTLVYVGAGSVVQGSATVGDHGAVGQDVTIGAKVVLGDGSSVGDGVLVADEARIQRRTEIGRHTSIGARSTIGADVVAGTDVIVGDDVDIGYSARIADGAVFESGAAVGNFAEVGQDATVRHDSRIGRGATVSQGAVVHEGARVGAGAHIGASVQLGALTRVRPMARVGDNTTIGEATVVGRDVRIGAGSTIGHSVRIGAGVTLVPGSTIPDETIIPRCTAGCGVGPGQLDQVQDIWSGGNQLVGQPAFSEVINQGFTPALSGRLTQIDVVLQLREPTWPLTLRLRDADGTGAPGPLLAEMTVSVDLIGGLGLEAWYSFDVASLSVDVSAGTLYYLELAAASIEDVDFPGEYQYVIGWSQSYQLPSGPYPGGAGWLCPDGTCPGPHGNYTGEGSVDFTFRTYVAP